MEVACSFIGAFKYLFSPPKLENSSRLWLRGEGSMPAAFGPSWPAPASCSRSSAPPPARGNSEDEACLAAPHTGRGPSLQRCGGSDGLNAHLRALREAGGQFCFQGTKTILKLLRMVLLALGESWRVVR